MTTFFQRLAGSLDDKTSMVTDADYGTVLVLYTGGTIGMKLNSDNVYVSERDYLHNWLSQMPPFHDPEYSSHPARQSEQLPFLTQFRYPPLYMPVVSGNTVKHLLYVIYEYQPVIDSSNMDFDNMLQVALDIKRLYKKFDGFVVLHGTDTMCYTAAALSFILENLGKPVILTGSQIPIYETRSDGRDHLTGALILAASHNIPEVCIFFGNRLFRGNRCRKVSADSLDAFDSPNYPPLAKLEISCTVHWDLIQKPNTLQPFNVHTQLSPNVAILRIFPSLSAAVIRAFLRDPIEGVVLQCYGAGNFPDENLELVQVLCEATSRGVIIVSTTQCRRGTVSTSYSGAHSLLKAGVVAGFDMTSEAALAKLSYVLTKQWTLEKKREYMSLNDRGEITHKKVDMPKKVDLGDGTQIFNLYDKYYNSSDDSRGQLSDALIMPLICLAVRKGNTQLLEEIIQAYPRSVLLSDYDQRTCLHIAVKEGSYDVVKFLINNGALVHLRDKFNRTPLLEAVYGRRFDAIELLLKAGSLLNLHPEAVARELNQSVSHGDIDLITAFWNAGAKLNVWDYNHVTPLMLAVMTLNVDIITYLCKRGADPTLCDRFNRNCFGLTVNQRIIEILEEAAEAKRWIKFRCRSTGVQINEVTVTGSMDNLVILPSKFTSECPGTGSNDSSELAGTTNGMSKTVEADTNDSSEHG